MAVRQMSDMRNLEGHINPPVVQDAVLAYIDALGAPFLIGEVWRPLGLPRTAVNRVLDRLMKKGFVTRHKIPVEGRNGFGRAETRMQYLYRAVSE